MRASSAKQATVALAVATILAGCAVPGRVDKAAPIAEVTAGANPTAATGAAPDVEAPDVFKVADEGLWDGRPSLGGIWVAHADVKDPERVMIRNTDNGRFVVGALFRRERENPGPAIQVSSDAAAALGMLAGAPDKLSVVALRREEPAAPEVAAAAAAPDAPATGSDAAAVPGDASVVADGAQAAPKEKKKFRWFWQKKPVEPVAPVETAAVGATVDDAAGPSAAAPDAATPSATSAVDDAAIAVNAPAEPQEKKFRWFWQKKPDQTATPAPVSAAPPAVETAVLGDVGSAAPVVAEVASGPGPQPVQAAKPARRKGLFGFLRRPAPAREPLTALAPVSASSQAATEAPAQTNGGKFIQVGLFSKKVNAQSAAQQLREGGVVPTVRESKGAGATSWRVLAGPVTSSADRKAILKKVQAIGFGDAYLVSG